VLNPNDQLGILQSELAKMSATFGPSYPPIMDLKKRIADLSALVENRGRGAKSRGRAPGNPAYLQVSAALKAAEGNLQSFTARREDMKRRLADYEGRLRQTPVIAGEYAHLRQSLDQAAEEHRKVEEKRAAAEIAETLEHEGKGRRLTVVDPPIVPHKPAQPIRLILIVLGLTLATLGGLGGAVIAEYFDPRIYSARQLRSLTGEAPLASIPLLDRRPA
jgi:protein tyrosine kinase modulator